jgi:hypothetical protein
MSQQLTHGHGRSGGDQPPERRPHSVIAVLPTVFVAVLAALLTGSAAHVGATGQARPRIVPPIYRMVYLPNDQDRRIAEAKDRLVADCMAAHGLSYTAHVEDVTEDEALAALRPFGLESLDDATIKPLPAEPVHNEQYARVLFGDPNQRMVARGERLEISWPATGCQADSEYRLLGDQRQRASELRLRLYDGERDAREELDQDRAFIAANERWRTCVRRLGFDAPNPGDLLSGLPSDTDLANNPAARTDLHCKQQTGYLDTAYTRLAVLQQDWMDAHPDLVDQWLALRKKQDAVAQQVLASH